jgi:hypothetical protein
MTKVLAHRFPRILALAVIGLFLSVDDCYSMKIGPFDHDISYTIYQRNPKTGDRIGTALRKNYPLKAGTSDWFRGACEAWSVEVDPPANWNSFVFIATDGANNAINLDAYLLGTDPIEVPSIFLDSGVDTNLVGIIDVKTFYENYGQFHFDPSNLQTFEFVNGVSSLLRGFTVAVTSDLNLFHDDAFEFVDGVGVQFDPASGASLFTGTATARGSITCDPCPEPSTAILGVMCASLLAVARISREKAKSIS